MNYEFICGVLLLCKYKCFYPALNELRNILRSIVFRCLEGEEKCGFGFVAELATIREEMANIQTLQVVGVSDNLQRMNSLYDFC